jgi:hypothetical protein
MLFGVNGAMTERGSHIVVVLAVIIMAGAIAVFFMAVGSIVDNQQASMLLERQFPVVTNIHEDDEITTWKCQRGDHSKRDFLFRHAWNIIILTWVLILSTAAAMMWTVA